jgi:hypothetical protein
MRSVVKITKGVHLPQLYPSKSVRVMMEAFLSYNLVIMKITHKGYKFTSAVPIKISEGHDGGLLVIQPSYEDHRGYKFTSAVPIKISEGHDGGLLVIQLSYHEDQRV